MLNIKKIRGFTLIELMITVLIVGILASIAYPTYMNSVRKGHRADAKAVLMQAAQWMERFYTANNRYDQTATGTSVNSSTQFLASGLTAAPIEGATKYYNITLAPTQTAFTLSAAPQGDQTHDTCGTLTFTNTGAKGASSASTQTAIDDCWR